MTIRHPSRVPFRKSAVTGDDSQIQPSASILSYNYLEYLDDQGILTVAQGVCPLI